MLSIGKYRTDSSTICGLQEVLIPTVLNFLVLTPGFEHTSRSLSSEINPIRDGLMKKMYLMGVDRSKLFLLCHEHVEQYSYRQLKVKSD